jgi:AcrR family transcriptional regulator
MPKIVDRDVYRKQLLEESFELFAELGYSNISMRQLAQRMGVSTGTLYHYFSSKEAMFLQLVEELIQKDIAQFLDRYQTVPKDFKSRVRSICDFTKENRDYFTKQLLIWMDYYQQHRPAQTIDNPLFDRLDRQTIRATADYLQIDNLAIAEYILTFINGLILCELYRQDSIWDQQVELLIEMVVRQLTAIPD